MDEDSKKILNIIGINFDLIDSLDNFFIPREQLLSNETNSKKRRIHFRRCKKIQTFFSNNKKQLMYLYVIKMNIKI